MNETKKEKRIRYLLIVFFVLFTISAFVYRMDKNSIKKVTEPHMMVVVLKESKSVEENPIIALYHKQFDDRILTYYEIERNNQFRFRAREAITLKSAPTEMARDQNGDGVWTKVNGKWVYFDQFLQKAKNNLENKTTSLGQPVSFQQEKEGSQLRLIVDAGDQSKKEISLTTGEQPTALYSLSEDGTVWLVLFENEVKIATINTN